MTEKIDLEISDELKMKLDYKIKDTNFKSIQEYLLYILNQMFSEDLESLEAYSKEEEQDIRGDEGYTREEEEDLKKTLDEMGYI